MPTSSAVESVFSNREISALITHSAICSSGPSKALATYRNLSLVSPAFRQSAISALQHYRPTAYWKKWDILPRAKQIELLVRLCLEPKYFIKHPTPIQILCGLPNLARENDCAQATNTESVLTFNNKDIVRLLIDNYLSDPLLTLEQRALAIVAIARLHVFSDGQLLALSDDEKQGLSATLHDLLIQLDDTKADFARSLRRLISQVQLDYSAFIAATRQFDEDKFTADMRSYLDNILNTPYEIYLMSLSYLSAANYNNSVALLSKDNQLWLVTELSERLNIPHNMDPSNKDEFNTLANILSPLIPHLAQFCYTFYSKMMPLLRDPPQHWDVPNDAAGKLATIAAWMENCELYLKESFELFSEKAYTMGLAVLFPRLDKRQQADIINLIFTLIERKWHSEEPSPDINLRWLAEEALCIQLIAPYIHHSDIERFFTSILEKLKSIETDGGYDDSFDYTMIQVLVCLYKYHPNAAFCHDEFIDIAKRLIDIADETFTVKHSLSLALLVRFIAPHLDDEKKYSLLKRFMEFRGSTVQGDKILEEATQQLFPHILAQHLREIPFLDPGQIDEITTPSHNSTPIASNTDSDDATATVASIFREQDVLIPSPDDAQAQVPTFINDLKAIADDTEQSKKEKRVQASLLIDFYLESISNTEQLRYFKAWLQNSAATLQSLSEGSIVASAATTFSHNASVNTHSTFWLDVMSKIDNQMTDYSTTNDATSSFNRGRG